MPRRWARYWQAWSGWSDEGSIWKIPPQDFETLLVRARDFVATLPAEVFCEIGLELKARSPFKPTFVVSLAHGYTGYLPTVEQHALGGYETWLGTSRLEVEAAPKLVDALLRQLGRLDASPRRP